MIDDSEIEEFKAWKRAKDKSGFDEAFHLLEQTLVKPASRQFHAIMPSTAYRVLGEALMALKNRLTEE